MTQNRTSPKKATTRTSPTPSPESSAPVAGVVSSVVSSGAAPVGGWANSPAAQAADADYAHVAVHGAGADDAIPDAESQRKMRAALASGAHGAVIHMPHVAGSADDPDTGADASDSTSTER